jgi:hypothetical protein
MLWVFQDFNPFQVGEREPYRSVLDQRSLPERTPSERTPSGRVLESNEVGGGSPLPPTVER